MIPSLPATATIARLCPARCGDVFGIAATEIATRLAVFSESPRIPPRLTESHGSGRMVLARHRVCVEKRFFPEHCAAPRSNSTPFRFSPQAGPNEPDGLGGRSLCEEFGLPPRSVPAIRHPAIRHPAIRHAPRREAMTGQNQPRLVINNQAARFSQSQGLNQHRHCPTNTQPAHRPGTPATLMAPFAPCGWLQQVRRPTASRLHLCPMKLHGTKVPAFPAPRAQDRHRSGCRGSPHHPITSPHAWSCGDS